MGSLPNLHELGKPPGEEQGYKPGRITGPVYTKKILIVNLAVISISHLFSSIAFLPFLVLQSSVSIWYNPVYSDVINVNKGSYLVSASSIIAAGSALVAPWILRRISPTVTIASCNGIMIIFYLSHIYNVLYVTIPSYIILGLIQGALSSAHISFLLSLSHKITGLFHEEDDEGRTARRTVVIRRVARAFQGSHDFGLIVGSVLSALIITCTVNLKNNIQNIKNVTDTSLDSTVCAENSSYLIPHCQNNTDFASSNNIYDYSAFLDDIFDTTEDGRLCGAQACPVSSSSINSSLISESGFSILPRRTADVLVIVYGAMCGIALMLAVFSFQRTKMLAYQEPMEKGEIISAIRAVKESFRDIRLQMAAPLAVFIGIEQAFMYAGFSKSYVVCTLGIHRLNLVFLAMGLLQSIAACTLSMLLRTIRRYYVVGVGFAFHGCLIMVLILWNPSEDDPALFYVISASWGVCNAIWEMLIFTFLTGQYADNWEAAFANANFFKFSGLSLSFLLHGFLCNIWKLYSLAFLMVIAVVSFAWLEVWMENMRKVKNISRL